MVGSRGHWEDVYARRKATAVSWYQAQAQPSLALIAAAAPDRDAPVIDVGGGASTLVDGLLACGFTDLTVLDVAEPALATARARLGAKAASVSWIAADITRWTPGRRWRIWHDRAVFHFLTERAMQDAYIGALLAGTEPDATAIIATFAPDGPATCSGLTVARYSAETLAERIGASFALGSAAREIHTTPAGVQQPFVYAVLKRQARQERLRSPLP